MSIKERLRINRPVLHDSLTEPYCGVINREPISIVDNIENENEEEEYEEMEDEEDDDDEVFSSSISVPGHQEVDSAIIDDRLSSTYPQCLVCGRTSTPKTRLFKWPANLQLRKSWLTFFRLSMDYLDNCKDPYICSIHFDADQFLYEGDRIFWKQNPFPRFRQRRSMLSNPFPWELELNVTKELPVQSSHPVQLKHGAAHRHRVTFRESYFKSKSKSSHPVAVVSLPDNPDVFYEFSYTRTSSIDSSKFYSCLTCRRAKTDTRVKDVIRTIHIKDGTIRSRGDPFWGHHFACRPLTTVKMSSPIHRNDAQYYAECIEHTDLNGRQCSKESYVEHFKQTPFLEMSSTSGLCSMEASQSTSREQRCPVSDVSPSLSKMSKMRLMQQQRSPWLPQCHICRRVVPSTQLLVQHLLRHMKLAPDCRCCGSKMSPDDHVRLRRMKTCSVCVKKFKLCKRRAMRDAKIQKFIV